MSFFAINYSDPVQTRHLTPVETPPREHCKKQSMATSRRPFVHRKNRSACTTSSTLLSCQSSPSSSSSEEPRTPDRSDILSYYSGGDGDDSASCQDSACFGGWIMNRFFSPSQTPKKHAFTPTNSSDQGGFRHKRMFKDAIHHASPSKLGIASDSLDGDVTDGFSLSSFSCPSQSSTDVKSAHETLNTSALLENTLLMATKSEDDYNLNAAITHIENYLYHLQSLGQHGNPTFALRRASALHKLGCLQWQCGRYQISLCALIESRTLYDHLIENYSSSPSPDVMSSLVLASANVLVSMGRLHLSKGEGAAAMQCYHECVHKLSSIKTKCNRSETARMFAQASAGAGRVLLAQGKLSSSMKRFKRALKVQLGYEDAGEDIAGIPLLSSCAPLSDIADTLSHIGRVYEKQQHLDQAIECYAKSFQLYSMSLGPNHPDTGTASIKLGQVFHRIGRFSEADKSIRRAYTIFVNNLGENHRNTSAALLNLGMLYSSQGKHKRAQEIYHQVLRNQQDAFHGASHADLALTYHHIAASYEASFRLEKSVKYYNQELSVLRAALHPYHLDIAKLLHHMATVTMNIVDNEGYYLMLNESIGWLKDAADIYQHHNESNEFEKELSHLTALFQRLQRRRHIQLTY